VKSPPGGEVVDDGLEDEGQHVDQHEHVLGFDDGFLIHLKLG
jgi:hypothetical protein